MKSNYRKFLIRLEGSTEFSHNISFIKTVENQRDLTGLTGWGVAEQKPYYYCHDNEMSVETFLRNTSRMIVCYKEGIKEQRWINTIFIAEIKEVI